ncbi:MAG: dienelactone hydrolase family protein [Alphaproteobacteria bacterium]|nr:dienelactone hydrolase family protein [Alphaproteobacteria bacterium]
MTVQTRAFDYEIDGKTYEAVLASPDGAARPGVLVCHTWAGRSEFEVERAKALAALGYTGIAIDLYGKGVFGATTEEKQGLLTPFLEDREMLRSKLLATLDIAKQQAEVDAENIAAIGFCFGGLSVLNIARTGADIKGVVSIHGLLGKPGNATGAKIKAKVLVLHGWDDPLVPPDDVVAFTKEMTEAGVDWQLHAYGGTMHAFTHPEANDPDNGMAYSADADRRSWAATANFLEELFA